jgi:hypothetical protein
MGRVECPICLTMLDWERAPLVTIGADLAPAPFALPPDASPALARILLDTAYRTCSGGGGGGHYLPATYGEQDVQRITIAMIGNSAAGKSHLLAAMIGQFMRGVRLRELDLQVDPLDLRIHKDYVDKVVTPFLDRRELLKRTDIAAVQIADAFLVTNLAASRRYAVTFFDVSGELLARAGADQKEFLGAVDAVIFVVDPQAIRGLARSPVTATPPAAAPQAGPAQEPGVTVPESGSEGDPSFDVALKLLRLARAETAEFLHIPAAIIVAKADLLRRSDPLVDRWLRADADEDLDLSTVEEESGDVFAYLYAHGADRWLEPAQRCIWSTLHFASAAGTAPRADHFPEASFRPRRVIKPLLALLAARGVIDQSAFGRAS